MRAIDTEQVKAYWLIGRNIVEEEQVGKLRAGYGTYLLQEISSRLTREFDKGFGLTTIKDIRRFYLAYQQIRHAVRDESILAAAKTHAVRAKSNMPELKIISAGRITAL